MTSATGIAESPVPTGVTTILGAPEVGETLTCLPSGFDARASIRPAGSKARASRRGRGTIRLAVTTRRKLARRPRVVVRYRSATASVRAVVPTGRTAKLAAGGR